MILSGFVLFTLPRRVGQGVDKNDRIWIHTIKRFLKSSFLNLHMNEPEPKEGRWLFQSHTLNLWQLRARTVVSWPSAPHLFCNIWDVGPWIDLWILTNISSIEQSLGWSIEHSFTKQGWRPGMDTGGLRYAEEMGPALWNTPEIRFTEEWWNAVSWSTCLLSEYACPGFFTSVQE